MQSFTNINKYGKLEINDIKKIRTKTYTYKTGKVHDDYT